MPQKINGCSRPADRPRADRRSDADRRAVRKARMKTVPPGVEELGLLSEWQHAMEVSLSGKSPMSREVARAMANEIEHRARKSQPRTIVIAKAKREASARFGPANANWKRKESVYDRLH